MCEAVSDHLVGEWCNVQRSNQSLLLFLDRISVAELLNFLVQGALASVRI